MKIIETMLAQLTDTETLLESVYQALSEADPNFTVEITAFESGFQALLREVPGADSYLQVKRQKFASDIRFAIWQGFKWSLDCFQNPLNKLLAQLDFEELCQEPQMHTLPEARSAQAATRAFVQSLSEDKRFLLEPIIDHFAYLETYGYKLAHNAGCCIANKLLSHVTVGHVTEDLATLICSTEHRKVYF